MPGGPMADQGCHGKLTCNRAVTGCHRLSQAVMPLGIQQRRYTAISTAFSCCIPVYSVHTSDRAARRGIQLYSGIQRYTVKGGAGTSGGVNGGPPGAHMLHLNL